MASRTTYKTTKHQAIVKAEGTPLNSNKSSQSHNDRRYNCTHYRHDKQAQACALKGIDVSLVQVDCRHDGFGIAVRVCPDNVETRGSNKSISSSFERHARRKRLDDIWKSPIRIDRGEPCTQPRADTSKTGILFDDNDPMSHPKRRGIRSRIFPPAVDGSCDPSPSGECPSPTRMPDVDVCRVRACRFRR
jgi:hypothetical protein